MNQEEAERQLEKYLSVLRHDDIGTRQHWFREQFELRQLQTGDWLAAYRELPEQGILLKSDGANVSFSGALGKAVPLLGLPFCREYFLGSACKGRYQIYERGLAVWEELKDRSDIGYPVAKWTSIDERARSCYGLIAFFDLRGFTNWSKNQKENAATIQRVIETLERSFQDAFWRQWCKNLFVKSTGDGFMVVSEADWFDGGDNATDDNFQREHVKAFCRACAETVRNFIKNCDEDLAIGCGITSGPITQLYLLGRIDYIGPLVNEASKTQAVAYNELCISDSIQTALVKDGVNITGHPLPGRGLRVSAAEVIKGTEGVVQTISS